MKLDKIALFVLHTPGLGVKIYADTKSIKSSYEQNTGYGWGNSAVHQVGIYGVKLFWHAVLCNVCQRAVFARRDATDLQEFFLLIFYY